MSEGIVEIPCKKCNGTGKIGIDSGFSKEVCVALEELGITPYRLSRYCNLSPLTISNIVKCKARPHAKTIGIIRNSIVKIRVEGISVPKRGRKKKDVNKNVNEGDTGEADGWRAGVTTHKNQEQEEPTRRVFYQAEADDDWAEEVEAEDGE